MNIESFKKYHRLSNYLGAAMLYLQDNYLLERELKHEDIKPRILGHWGTVPGLNLIYGGLNGLIQEKQIENTLLITGPGHGAPAILAGIYLDGSLADFYNEATLDKKGLEYIIKQFSWPGGFPSHTYPGLPGQIHEGGELGYSLGVAYGSVLDKPDLFTVAVIGDGESETGPLAASWHSNKFVCNQSDGLVLPILHLNGYKISGPTVPAAMTDDELNAFFWGLGYEPWIVDQYKEGENFYNEFYRALSENYERLHEYKSGKSSRIPMMVLRSMKGWTGPDENQFGIKIEDNNLSHGIPLKNPKTSDEELAILDKWLRSYNVHELLDDNTQPIEEIKDLMPEGTRRIGTNKYATGNPPHKELRLPKGEEQSFNIQRRGQEPDSPLENLTSYLRGLLEANDGLNNFRVFSPDESESNKLEELFEATCRVFSRDMREHDIYLGKSGRMMEILSEHVLQEWMQGYAITGGNSVFVSYEAFLNIIISMIDQHIKYIEQSRQFHWRKPIPSLNYISTSTTWRQDHNGFSHQNPTLINSLLAKNLDFVSAYFPADANTLVATFEDSLQRKDAVNLITSGKRDLPQWLSLDEAREHVRRGISVWDWAGNYRSNFTDPENEAKHNDAVDVVLASAGDYQTQETLAAAQLLKELMPELKYQYVNINELTRLGLGDERNPLMTQEDYEHYFTKDKFVVFNFHGYPSAVKQLLFNSPLAHRTVVLGYMDKGTTTTPFDMQVVNRASRYHVMIQAIMRASSVNPDVAKNAEKVLQHVVGLLAKHRRYIEKHGDDMPEIKEFKFSF